MWCVYPETALTGYFLEGGVREHAVPAMSLATDLAERYARAGGDGRALDVVLGFYEVWGHRLYNSAMYLELGATEPRIVHVHRKVFLPTYGVFQEERFVEAGHSVRAFDTRWGRAAMLICEDLFHSISATLAALDGAQLLLVPSASPARGAQPGSGVPSNLGRWRRLAQGAAEEHGVGVAVSQLTGFEGGKGFAGGSLVFGPRGQLLAEGPLWDEAVIDTGLDLEELTAARTDQPLLADLERALPRLLQSRHLPPLEGGFAPTPTEAATASEDEGEWAGRPPRAGMSGAMDPALVAIDPELVRRVAGSVSPGRDAGAPGFRAGGDRPVRRRGLRAHRGPVRQGAGPGERDRLPASLPDLEPGERRARDAGGREPGNQNPHHRH